MSGEMQRKAEQDEDAAELQEWSSGPGFTVNAARLGLPDSLEMGYARIRAANGDVHDVTFVCVACERRLIWSFEDWKCPCGGSSFRIDNAVLREEADEAIAHIARRAAENASKRP